jgi:hypothetical protein
MQWSGDECKWSADHCDRTRSYQAAHCIACPK